MKSHQQSKILFILVFGMILVSQISAAEILFQQEWSRIITGDQATRFTRELGETPVPTRISGQVIQKILKQSGLPTTDEAQINAWQTGLQQHGWAQFENEPEYASYQVLQLVATAEKKCLVKKYALLGQTMEAVFALTGEMLSEEAFEIDPGLGRTVFYTVLTPANFVLNQEHFQKHFFEGMLNLDYPGLEKAKAAYEKKMILLAAHEVAEYFRRKQHPVWESKLPEPTAVIDEAAETVLRHEFRNGDEKITFGSRIDWYNNPVRDNSEWIWGLNRMGHWGTLLKGYLKTGNEAYASEFNAEVIDWTVRNPAPPFRLTRVPSWRNLEAGIRMTSTWPRAFFGFLASPSFTTQAVQLMLASIWSHAEHILRFPSGMRFVNNWVIIGSTGLANVGMYYPEFQKAPVYAETGLTRLSRQLEKQVYPDGVQHELATSYHVACLHSFHQAYEVALKTDTPIPPNFRDTLESMFQYLMYVGTPLRELPPTNDAHRTDIKSWLLKGADQFQREDMRYVATFGEQGQVPDFTSYSFDWGGHQVMRSDWRKEGWYLFFDNGPCGVSHQHEDKLHVDVTAFGRDFLTDGGKGKYIPDKWRTYFLSTASHNSVLIDGQGQRRIPFSETHRATRSLKNQWFSDAQLDFAWGIYDHGYGVSQIPVTHTRFVLFKKVEYWLVVDLMEGKGAHSFDLIYHFMPAELIADAKQNQVQTNFEDGKNLQLITAANTPLAQRIATGEENPEQGWVSLTGAGRVPSPAVIFSGKHELPALMTTVIQPFQSEDIRIEKVAMKKVSRDQVEIVVHTPWGVDHWALNLAHANRLVIDGESESARVVFRREASDGQIGERFQKEF